MQPEFLIPARVRFLLLVAMLLTIGPQRPVGAFTFYQWASGVSGLTSDATKWNPNGVPVLADRLAFTVAGTYTVTFPVATSATNMITCSNGTMTLRMSSPHTTSAFNVAFPSLLNSLEMNLGTLNVDYMHLGGLSSATTVFLTEDGRGHTIGTLTSRGTGNPNAGGPGDQIGNQGITEFHVTNGARYVCNRSGPATGTVHVAALAGSSAKFLISGSGGVPSQPAGVFLTGGATMTVGGLGTANLFVSERGFIDATGDVVVATGAGSAGYVTVGPVTGGGTSFITARARLAIGGNLAAGNAAGHGELTVKSSGRVSTTGACEVGDPDNDGMSVLRVQTGGIYTALGGLKIWPTAGTPLDLQGGLAHINGGAFQWPVGKFLRLSSQTGTPELWMDNGIINVGPNTTAGNAQLYVARSGNATLHLSRPGTAFTMGPGSCIVGDSTGGNGTILVDSTATFSSQGPMNIGNRGGGNWLVKGGSLADVGTLAVGVSAGGTGFVNVTGAGSKLRTRDNVWIGGGFGGAGGSGLVRVEDGATLEVLHVTGINPALITIYPWPLNGSLEVQTGGRITTTGSVSNTGLLTLMDGVVEALSTTLTPTGTLVGYGQLVTMLQSAGNVDPGAGLTPMRTIHVDGSYVQFGNGRYTVDLDASGGPASDLLEIDGPAQLSGTLALRPAAGFSGTPGQFFTILTCTARTGTFSAVTWNGAPLGGQAEVVYGPNYVGVVIPGVSGVGDIGSGVSVPEALSFATLAGSHQPAFVLALPEAAQVQVRVYDLNGREVATLFEGALEPSRRRFELRAPGRKLAMGTYFARAVIRIGERTTVRTARTTLVH